MEFHAVRELHGDALQLIRLECDLLCPLGISVHIGGDVAVRKLHVHVRDLRLPHAVIVKLHRKRPPGIVCAGKCVAAPVRMACRHMGKDETLPCGKVRVFLCKKTFLPAGFRAIIADFRKRLLIL